MTTALRARIDRRIPTAPAELSEWDLRHSPALRLVDTLDTEAVPVIASRRPVAATPHAPAPVPAHADKFGPLPSVLPRRSAARAGNVLAILSPVAIGLGVIGGLLWR